jgi:hypothetical protein
MKKIVFVSAHDYVAKRQGGFHVFAKELSSDFEVVFFSYPRSSFIKIRKNCPIEYNNISYTKDRDIVEGNVRNVSRLFHILPVSILRHFPKSFQEWNFRFGIPSMSQFCDKYFKGVDYFMFESNGSVVLFNYLKKKYPTAKFLYRPSDPMFNMPSLSFFHPYEKEYVRNCDFIFAVNQEGVDLYKEKVEGFPVDRCEIISNGIDLAAYDAEYPVPEEYKGLKNIASYIGARPAQWDMMIQAAETLKEVNWFIICPEQPTQEFKDAVDKYENLNFIQGISPKLVPQYVKNADIIIIPNPTDMYKKYPWGITAKYYQAMYSKKPIVTYSDQANIRELGVKVSYTYDDFINDVKDTIGQKNVEYNFDFSQKDWRLLAERMKNIILSL